MKAPLGSVTHAPVQVSTGWMLIPFKGTHTDIHKLWKLVLRVYGYTYGYGYPKGLPSMDNIVLSAGMLCLRVEYTARSLQPVHTTPISMNVAIMSSGLFCTQHTISLTFDCSK